MKALRFVLSGVLLWIAPASAATITYSANLNEDGESTSPGTGTAEAIVDTSAQTLTMMISFSNLTSGTTASHIHCCVAPPGTAGVATTVPSFPGFPLGVTSGTYDDTLDLTSAATYNPAFVTANGGTVSSAEAALLAGMAADMAYVNIHTTNFPGGEISGFLTATPEPASFVLAGALLFGILRLRPRRGR